MSRLVHRAAAGDGTDVTTVRQVGAEDADAAVISTGDDITASAMTALVMRDLGVDEIYVKVVSHDHALQPPGDGRCRRRGWADPSGTCRFRGATASPSWPCTTC